MRTFLGIDMATAMHWACTVDEGCRFVLDGAVDNTPAEIDAFIAKLRALAGEPVIDLDVVGSFAHFLEASLAGGLLLVHAPGIAVNRAGQGFAGGERKSDPKDARPLKPDTNFPPQ